MRRGTNEPAFLSLFLLGNSGLESRYPLPEGLALLRQLLEPSRRLLRPNFLLIQLHILLFNIANQPVLLVPQLSEPELELVSSPIWFFNLSGPVPVQGRIHVFESKEPG